MAGKTRFISENTPVISENLKIRLKADGGAVFVDENGGEDTFFVLGKTGRLGIDEMDRDKSSVVKIEGFEVEFIPESLPITVQTVRSSVDGGTVDANYIISNDSSGNWPELIEYLLKSLWVELKVGNMLVWDSLLSTEEKEINLGVEGIVNEEVKVSVINDRLGDTFQYNDVFAKIIDNNVNVESATLTTITEKLVENIQNGEVADLDLEFRLSFYGKEDTQVLN